MLQAVLAAGYPTEAVDMAAHLTDDIDEVLEVLPVCGHDVPNTKANYFIHVGDLGPSTFPKNGTTITTAFTT